MRVAVWDHNTEILHACSIGKENTSVHISTPIEVKQLTKVEIDVEVEANVKVDITEEANNSSISI